MKVRETYLRCFRPDSGLSGRYQNRSNQRERRHKQPNLQLGDIGTTANLFYLTRALEHRYSLHLLAKS